MRVNFLDLKKQYENIDVDNLMENIRDLITSGGFVGGPHLTNFEERFSAYCGTPHTVGVGSGTDALIFALAGLGIGPGDEVIVPANTFIASALAVSHVGATPVFVDVDPNTYLVTSITAQAGLSEKTKAIIPVHLYGNTVNMDDIMEFASENALKVVEDCAQAIGAKWNGRQVGTYGDAGCFSFYPAKNLGGLGQGGAIITPHQAIVDKAVCLGNVGRKEGSWYEYSDIGYNSRLDAINALFLNTCLDHIDDWNGRRKQAAKWYTEFLTPISDVVVPKVGDDHVYHLFELKFKDKLIRNYVKDKLHKSYIFSALHYPIPCHKQEVYKGLGGTVSLSVTEELADTLLSVPIHPFITQDEVRFICDALLEILKEIEENGLIENRYNS